MRPRKNQHGQVAVFYALLIPIFILFGGVGLDLGWYYLNVSRLQNAADAAVIVGAKTLLGAITYRDTEETLKAKGYRVKLVEQYPANSLAKDASGNVIVTTTGDEAVLAYVKKNLASESTAYKTPSFFSVVEAAPEDTGTETTVGPPYTLTNDYSKSDVTLTPTLYQDGDDYYYVVSMSEDIEHFFVAFNPLTGYLDAMNAGVVAVALISQDISNGSDPPGDDPQESGELRITFNANEGHFPGTNDDTTTLDIKSPSRMADDELSEPIKSPVGDPLMNGYIFKGWSLEQSEPGKIDTVTYLPADVLTKKEMEKYFGTNSEVTLYAVWEKEGAKEEDKIKPYNTKTLWEQMQYLIAKNVYPYYWWSARAKFGGDPINNRFNDVKVYYTVSTTYKKGTKFYQVTESEYNTRSTTSPDKDKCYWETKYEIGTKFHEVTKSEYDTRSTTSPDKDMYYWTTTGNGWNKKYGYYDYILLYGYYDKIEERVEQVRNYYAETLNLSTNAHDGQTIGNQTQYFIDFWQADSNLKFQAKDSNGKAVNESTERRLMDNDRKGTPCKRIHSLFNMNKVYNVRTKDGKRIHGDDPLYCRIEAEPYKSEATPIRQIVINVNVSNLDDNYRPLFFFYDGPDARASMSNDGLADGHLKPEDAQPVILNLNADFKGVLFMPDIPVVVNGNGHTFQGFIIAKEFRYLDQSQGTPVKYSTTGKTDQNYSNNLIRVNEENGDVYTTKITGDANSLWSNGKAEGKFNLSENSRFKKFQAASEVNFAYLYYDFVNLELDSTSFRNTYTGDLIPIFKRVKNPDGTYAKNSDGTYVTERVTNWDKVELHSVVNGKNIDIPKKITDISKIKALVPDNSTIQRETDINHFRGIVLLDGNNKPIPVYDDANNPVYFCKDYIDLRGTYDVLTLDKMDDTKEIPEKAGMRSNKEFLLTNESVNVSDTDDWL